MESNELAWTMIYTSILGISYHPRQMENGGKPSLTPAEAARVADEALIEWDKRYGAGN